MAIVLVVAACVAASSPRAQGIRGVPRLDLPQPPREVRDTTQEPAFRSAVTRVEVSALVLDRDGHPAAGLSAADFEVLENGVPQTIRSFDPFVHALGGLPLPEPRLDAGDGGPPISLPASNYHTSQARIFAVVLDDLHVDVRRTQRARAAARRLVAQLDPSDLLLVVTVGAGESTGYFTRDRAYALDMIERFHGQRLRDKTIGRIMSPVYDEDLRVDHYRRSCETIANVATALRDITGRRKTLLLISEGSSYGASMDDMEVRMPTATGGGRVNASSGSLRHMNEVLASAAAANVAIHPVNPLGLDIADADLIQVSGLRSGISEEQRRAIFDEARQSKETLRDLAAMTGGVSAVDSNDTFAVVDRAIEAAGRHYVLTYEPETPARGNEYRRIEVKVRRPGLRVLARRGYRPPSAAAARSLKAPDSVSAALGSLLSAVLPSDGLTMRVQAFAAGRRGQLTTVGLVVETDGAPLQPAADGGFRLEQGLLTIGPGGKAANGARRILAFRMAPSRGQVLTDSAVRSVWAVELPRGRHQVRMATVDQSTGRGGAVYLDVQIAGRDEPPPDLLIASHVLGMMPTLFVDDRVTTWVDPLPTTTRVFPIGDALTITAPHAGTAPARASLASLDGQAVRTASMLPAPAQAAVRFLLPLDGIAKGPYQLIVETSRGRLRTPIGVVEVSDR
jgi:VWFA-related protein